MLDVNHNKYLCDKLIKLIQENPDLPVVPMVDAEIRRDDCGYWLLGSWWKVRIDEYLLINDCDLIVFKSNDDVRYVLERYLSDEEFEKLPETEKECKLIYDSLPWTKAIIVYISSTSN